MSSKAASPVAGGERKRRQRREKCLPKSATGIWLRIFAKPNANVIIWRPNVINSRGRKTSVDVEELELNQL